ASHSTAIFVTHDQGEAMMLGDRIAVMRRGFVEQVDTPERIYHNPQNRFVAEFMGVADFLPAQVTADGLATEIGLLPPACTLQAGRQVEVMVRPHDLRISPQAGLASHGVVAAAEFIGDSWQYQVRLASGRSIHAFMPHTAVMPLGAAVDVSLRADHGLVCFEGETSLRN
ncbi:MAG: TOBE domain-containing protein, partial [Anaerolineae bacterium]|nr:TOBE domain-containing protein [Anaerolineae bacterium]